MWQGLQSLNTKAGTLKIGLKSDPDYDSVTTTQDGIGISIVLPF